MKHLKLILITTAFTIFSIWHLTGCSKPEPEVTGFDIASIDSTVKPQDDFYSWSVGNWIKNNPIPEDQTRWMTFTVLREETNNQIKDIIEAAAKNKSAEAGSIDQKIRDFYNSGMDSIRIENEGLSPLMSEFKRIDEIIASEDVAEEVAHMQKYTSSPLFYFLSSIDAKNSDSVIARIYQGGLGLPDRDYYLQEDDKSKEIRAQYRDHLQKMFQLLGDDTETASIETERVLKIETRLAKASNSRVENRDPEKTYNKMSTADLSERYSGFNWDVYFSNLELDDPGKINISQPEFIAEVSDMMNSISIDEWKSYLRWNLIHSTAYYLSSDFINETFEFFVKTLRGQQKIQPRWKRVQRAVSPTRGNLGEAVGQLYVEKHFPPEAKEKARKIVGSLIVAMEESINNLDWMSDETKKQALVKLSGFGIKIGYPDKWTDYSELEITPDSYVKNVMACNYFDHKKSMSEINSEVKPWEWNMTPQTVNAYYSPTRNEIVFPAAILQFPFYDYRVDDAINYGAMGAVIGHEITHGFDDSGRKYDAEGNLRDWWTEKDSRRFEERAKMVVEQYNAYNPVDDLHINGELTNGENIADLGGITIAYNAFTKTDQFKRGEKIDGFTPQQRFFLGWAQLWKGIVRKEEAVRLLKVDSHSPGKYRVNGPFSNFPPFFEAFNIKEGDPMRRDNLIKIW
jgi:putative endopeptidase